MTTHLEEVLEKLEQKYCAFEFCCDDADTVSKPQLELLKRAFINSHIAYLEKEILRLKVELTDRHKQIYDDSSYFLALEKEISHKQQELLQAKELLK